MRMYIAACWLGVWATLMGCNHGAPGGIGASSAASPLGMDRQADHTFSLTVPSATLVQGESKSMSVAILRGMKFDEDVSFQIGALPKGVTLNPAGGLIERSECHANFALNTAGDAALGDFIVRVNGHTMNGAKAVTELRISVAKQDSNDAVRSNRRGARAKWDQYAFAVQNQWDEFADLFTELRDRAAASDRRFKAGLDTKLEDLNSEAGTVATEFDEIVQR